MSNHFCENCGARLPENTAFCGECGTKVLIKQEQPKQEQMNPKQNGKYRGGITYEEL